MENSSPNDESMSSRYRRFLIVGVGRVIITRILSFFYILYVSRNFPRELQDKMIFLASVQGIVLQIALLGMAYSITQISITQKLSDDKPFSIAFNTMLIGLPIVILATVFIGLFSNLSLFEMLFFVLSTTLQYIMELGVIMNQVFLNIDKSIFAYALFSVLNSITVPLFFIISPTLTFVLFAWTFSFIFPLLYIIDKIIPILKHRNIGFKAFWEFFKFGWPLYLSYVFIIIASKIDPIILFIFFEEGETSQYFWVMRIAQIAQEFYVSLISGLGPLLMKILSQNSQKEFDNLMNSIMRISILVGSIFFSSIIFQARSIIIVILSYEFIQGLVILKILLLAYVVDLPSRVFNLTLGAEGARKKIMIGRIGGTTFRFVVIVLLSSFGSIGLAIAFLCGRIFISSYFYYSKRSVIAIRKNYARVLLVSISVILFSFIFDIGGDWTSVIIELIVGLLFLLLIFQVKPLYQDDWLIVDRVIGDRFLKLKNMLRTLLVHS